jgi:hypothetical protein
MLNPQVTQSLTHYYKNKAVNVGLGISDITTMTIPLHLTAEP